MSRVRRELARLMMFLALCVIAPPGWALEVPPLTGRVVDPSHVLPTPAVESLTAQLAAHEAKTSNQVAVLIIPSLDGDPFEEFSHRVATTWRLGQKDTDNGALLFVAMKERKVRIEVGYGLEGALTDARSAQIIRNEIVPRFRAGDMPGGVVRGVDAILKTIEGTYQASDKAVPRPDNDVMGQVVVAVIVGLVVGLGLMNVHRLLGPVAGTGLSVLLAPWLVPALITGGITLLLLTFIGAAGAGGRKSGRRGGDDWVWYSSRDGGWGGGSFGSGGGGFSGVGGDFGGGGASGNW
ncbi:MAG: TPM domain-containing protein [Nitrospirae bacterium]|nr:TPM domain-containing protein [Nitrospirota bacterium]